jgi:predicted lipoprotein
MTCGAVAQEATPLGAVAQRAVEDVFRPGFAAYAEATTELDASFDTLCAAPGSDTLAISREAFAETVAAWSRVELYSIGPLREDNRSERILFWPDRKGIALRQVQQILAEGDETAADPTTLVGKSVAVQGLGALEYLLWGTGADSLAEAEGGFRCRYAGAIGTVLAETGTTMAAEWADPEGFSKRLISPTESDADYRNTREVAEELSGLLAHGVELIRDQRLLPFLGRDGAPAKPKSALFWRSGLTAASVAGNFDGLKALFQGSGLDVAGGAENAWVANTGGFEFRNAERALALLTKPVEAVLEDEKQRHAYDYLVLVSQSLGTILGENLPAALGLSVGFSSLDGD